MNFSRVNPFGPGLSSRRLFRLHAAAAAQQIAVGAQATGTLDKKPPREDTVTISAEARQAANAMQRATETTVEALPESK